jgi:DNA-binding MarR family transcriptional regulator
VQASGVSVDRLTDALVDFITRLRALGEAGTVQMAAGLDLSLTQLCLLFILEESEQAPAVHELAERLGLSVAATGRAVDVLAREGFVVRREDEHDRRVKRVSLSDSGDRLLLRLVEAHRDGLKKFAGLLTTRERADLFNVLSPILERQETESTKAREK